MSSDLILYAKISRCGSWIYSSYSLYLDKSDSVFRNMEPVIGYKSESDQYLPTINIEL